MLTLTALTAVIYGPFYDNPLIYETTYHLYHYREVLDIPLAALVSFWPLTPFRPVSWFSYSVIYHFFGLNPLAYYAVSFSLHLINATLLSTLAYRLSRDRILAVLAAMVFFLSYHHSEVLLWKNAQSQVIGGFWFLLSLIAYIQHRQKKRWWAFLVSLMCFYLAVFSSQATIGLVAICLLYDMIYPPSGWSLGRAVASSCLRLTAFLPAIGLAVAIALHRGNLVKRYFLSFISPVKNVITILSHPWYSFGPQGVTDLYRQSPSALALVRNLLEAPNSGAIVALLLCAAGT
ncbi:hypothetical protein MYX19_04455, partial [Nitrospinae bacterium AH-259-F20]|nr:hypothetical protein [Nitrospinae bacterium AH-259-F20]